MTTKQTFFTYGLLLSSLTMVYGPSEAKGKAGQPRPQAAKAHANTSDGNGGKLGAVRIANVSVKGLTPAQARQKLAKALRGKLNAQVRVTDGVRSLRKTRKDLGIGLDTEAMVGAAKGGAKSVPLRLQVNRATFQKVLRRLAPKFNYPGVDAHPVLQHGKFHLVGGQERRSVDVGKSAQILADLLEKKPSASTLQFVLDKKRPKISNISFKGINARIGTFVTSFNPASIKRTHNIRAAVKSINGMLLKPGQIFSMNQTVGERTHEHGFLTASVYENGKKVAGIGGGVSQVTGTLFNAALLAGLPIIEYGTHAKPVAYLPIARDATVAWNHIDLRFKNNTKAPIYIDYKASGSRCVATLYGAKTPGQTVRLSVQKKALGPRRITAVLYRVIKRNGKVVKKEKVGRSEYNWKPETDE